MKLISYDWLFCEIGLLNTSELCLDLLVQRLQTHRIRLDSPEFLLHRRQASHGAFDFLDEVALRRHQSLRHDFEVVHLGTVLHRHDFLLFPLLLPHTLLDAFSLPLLLLLVLLLDDSDALVEFGQQVRQLGVDLVDEVAEVDVGFVVDSLEEHNRGEVFLEVLQFVARQFPLQNVDDDLLLRGFDFLC